MSPTRDQVLDSALRTLNEHPTASLQEIATRAGISRATLHRQIESRDALITELGVRAVDEWEAALVGSGAEQAGTAEQVSTALRTLFRGYLDSAHAYSFALTDWQLETDQGMAERTHTLTRREFAVYRRAQQLGVLRADLEAEWIGWVAFGLLVAARDAVRFGDVGRNHVADNLISTFLHGCGAGDRADRTGHDG